MKKNLETTLISLIMILVSLLFLGSGNIVEGYVEGARHFGFKMDQYPDVSSNSNIFNINNCPDILLGRSGLNSEDWSKEYNFDSLNRKFYNYLNKNAGKETQVQIKIYLKREDKYGHENFDSYVIGFFYPDEAAKFKDFETWVRYNDLEPLIKSFIVKQYLPKAIQ